MRDQIWGGCPQGFGAGCHGDYWPQCTNSEVRQPSPGRGRDTSGTPDDSVSALRSKLAERLKLYALPKRGQHAL